MSPVFVHMTDHLANAIVVNYTLDQDLMQPARVDEPAHRRPVEVFGQVLDHPGRTGSGQGFSFRLRSAGSPARRKIGE